MLCKKCGKVLADGAKFCAFCGTQVEVEVKQNIKCAQCGQEFDPEFGMCPYCGAEIGTEAETEVETETEPAEDNIEDGENREADTTAKPPKKRRKVFIAVVAVILVVAILVTGVIFFPKIRNFLNLSGVQDKAASEGELSKSRLIDICDELDYSALARIFYVGFDPYIYDADGDGRQEFFFSSLNHRVYAFDTSDVGVMSAYDSEYIMQSQESILISENFGDKLYLEWRSSAENNTDTHYSKWTNEGWVEVTDEISDSDFADSDGGSAIGAVSHPYFIESRYYSVTDKKKIIDTYKKHLEDEAIGEFLYYEDDLDNDGETEYAFLIKDFAEKWIDNASLSTDSLELLDEWYEFFDKKDNVIMYADTDDEGIVVHTFGIRSDSFVNNFVKENYSIKWSDDYLTVSAVDIDSDLDFPCYNAEYSNPKALNDPDAVDAMAKRYADRCLANYTYSEISVKRVDICDAPGDEFIFVGTRYRPEITGYAIGNGKLIGIYPTSNACYLTERNGKNYLLCYNQIHNSESTNGYKRTYTDYEFWFQRYDTDYYSYKEGYKKITVYDDVEPNDTYKEFFDEFNCYLEKATVCCDSYELKGYKIMPSTEADYSVSEKGKYLSISNCDVNKSGTVNDEVFSWLNFRTGPGITYDRILTDRNDPESFVKQVRGSNVTVIDTVNTGDAENPIWVKIQIKYSTYSLTGYSSQKYIDINSIKHISVGESFKIKANTNDSNLKWTVNDSNVLSVNSSTGEITGKSRGLVLVKVTSDSGLTDSCLIMVD